MGVWAAVKSRNKTRVLISIGTPALAWTYSEYSQDADRTEEAILKIFFRRLRMHTLSFTQYSFK